MNGVMGQMFYPCRAAARLLSERQDRPLTTGERLRLAVHTSLCTACRTYGRQIDLIDAAFRLRAAQGQPDLPSSEALGEAARERIRAALRRGRG